MQIPPKQAWLTAQTSQTLPAAPHSELLKPALQLPTASQHPPQLAAEHFGFAGEQPANAMRNNSTKIRRMVLEGHGTDPSSARQ